MYRNFKEKSRSRSRERNATVDSDAALTQRAHTKEGNVQSRKQTSLPTVTLGSTFGSAVQVEGNSFDLEIGRTSSKKVGRTLMKALIDKEVAKGMEMRSSPSLVARLMGLDPLPSKQHKERGSNFRNIPSEHTANKSYPSRRRTNEYQECKDVFEVMEMPKAEEQNKDASLKGKPNSKKSGIDFKQSEIDWSVIKQKVMDEMDLSTDDEFKRSNEYTDAVEDLDPNKDFFQESNSLFRKHLQDLKCIPPSPHANHITILKPSKVTNCRDELCCASGRTCEKHCDFLKSDINSLRKHVTDIDALSGKEHSCSFPHKLSEPLYAGKGKGKLQHTQIVVLKPSLGKALDAATTVSPARSPDIYRDGPRKKKRVLNSKRSEVYTETRDRHKLSESMEGMGHKTKGLREIAREITKQLRTTGSSTSKMTAMNSYGYNSDESSHDMTGNVKSELLQWSPVNLNDSTGSLSASAYYSSESSVSREARKRLSERWKMAQKMQGQGPVDRGSSTLGEMLVSDREKPRACRSMSKNVSNGNMARHDVLARRDCPSGISSMDIWKDGSRSLPRPKSLPSSLLAYEYHCSSRNMVGGRTSSFPQNAANKNPNGSLNRNVSRRRFAVESPWNHPSGREKDELSEREIHVNSEILHARIHLRHLDENVSIVPELPNGSVVGSRGYEGGNLATQCIDKTPPVTNGQQVHQSAKLAVLVNGEDLRHGPEGIREKEQLTDHPQVTSHCDIHGSPSPVRSKESDGPSPVSVLDLTPSEEEKSSSECFEKISADLKGLRMQLKLLKRESADSDTEGLELHLSTDEDVGECHSPLNSGEILEAFRNDEDRDFSYLLDVLIDSGVHHINGSSLLQEYPVDAEVFEKLEKKYSKLVSWLRSERKLLFDLINSILASTFSSDQRSSRSRQCYRDGLVEEVWQMVVKQRKELSVKLEEKLLVAPKWLDLGDDVNMLGRELEVMLIEDLTMELLAQLISE